MRPPRRWRRAIALLLGLAGCVDDVGLQDLSSAPTAPPVRGYGAGFTDLTAPLDADPPFAFAPFGPGSFDDAVPLWGDIDHDGAPELVVGFVPENRPTRTPPPFGVYRYSLASRRFERVAGVALPTRQPLAGVLDLDGDGVTDLLALDRDGAVAWGLGQGTFAAPQALDRTPVSWGPSNYLHGFFVDDIDDDGWLDLLAVSDCCGTRCVDLHLFPRVALREFDERPDLLPISLPVKPYAAFSARFATGDHLVAGFGFSCSAPTEAPIFYRRDALDDTGAPTFTPFDPTPHYATFRPEPGRFPTISQSSPMGAVADDLDSDGALDLVVSLNPTHLFLRGTPRWPFEDRTEGSNADESRGDRGPAMIPWGVAALDLDRDGFVDLVFAHGNDQTAWTAPPGSFIGPQRLVAYRNEGRWRYSTLDDRVGLGRRGQFRTLTPFDLEGDGDPDLAVGGQRELARIYRNDIENGHGALALRLHGTTSNHLGVGAWVTAWVEGAPPQRRYVGGLSAPLTVVAPMVFLGLGPAARVARLEVTWPSGHVQRVDDVPGRQVVDLVEPETLTLSPSTRHAPADGRAVVTVRVTPRDPAGRPRPNARVTLALTGPGTLSAVEPDGDGWRATVTAPARPGSTVITARVDDRAIGVRPRIWWDAQN
ncbi:MAG: FG-GAP-like repeat-containing protein [Polyangiales bacterium]